VHVAIFVALGMCMTQGPERALPGAAPLLLSGVVCAAGAGYRTYRDCGTRYAPGERRPRSLARGCCACSRLRSTVTSPTPVRARPGQSPRVVPVGSRLRGIHFRRGARLGAPLGRRAVSGIAR
jgi:hypothetical protein